MENIVDCYAVSLFAASEQNKLQTFMESIHVELSNERRNICVLEILSGNGVSE